MSFSEVLNDDEKVENEFIGLRIGIMPLLLDAII